MAVIKAIITCMQFFFTAASCTLHLHAVQKLIGKSNTNTAIAYVYRGFSEMVRDHGNPRIAVVLFQDGYRFIYFLYCMLCQDGAR